MNLEKIGLWTKDFVIISLVNFSIALNFYLLMIIISEFAMNKFKALPSEAGLAAGIFIFGALIARLLSGKWIGIIGQQNTLYTGLILGLATTSLYFVANSVMLLLVIRFLHGISFGIASTATGTIVANIIPKIRCGEGIGYFGLSVTVASAIGPFIGMFFSQHGSYSMIFAACTIVSAFNIVIALFLSTGDERLTREQLAELKEFKLSNFFEPKVIPISVVCMVIFFCYSSVISFLSVYSKEINLMGAASFFYVVFAAVIFFSRPVVGRLFDSKGENLIMYSAILIFMIGMITFSQAHYGYMILLAGALIGLGYGAIQSSGQAIAVKATEPHRMGLATSTFFMLADVGMGIGPLIFGLVIFFTSYREMYMGVAIIVAVSLLLYYLLHGRTVKSEEKIIMKSKHLNYG
ncbi:MAG: MFS transporter [Bacillota bacterium]|jgi:MFS family permease